ncbi:putative HECT-type ubiquitin ligase-interacting protein [Escovopsis weberi]|uniref:Putative HECT-type ubiquitin ligase-interacting protein n=1 Tax=Escovopsis weberi TaxID=150374 RepID=A0A0M8N0E8_ESCWE|nr:putative HECT-type ubiquitin ligase-interacting protein [Escovopsis weberi]
MIEDSGQEGWTLNKALDLPKKLNQCIQDVDIHGVKVRHKIKLVIALQNPDGHLSELRATLPVSIFISPNIPFDEHGNLVRQTPNGSKSLAQDVGPFAPPGYGEHVLDQLLSATIPTTPKREALRGTRPAMVFRWRRPIWKN